MVSERLKENFNDFRVKIDQPLCFKSRRTFSPKHDVADAHCSMRTRDKFIPLISDLR